MKHHDMVDRLIFPDEDRGAFCGSCALGKQTKEKRSKHPGGRATELLELVHSDVCGPSQTKSPTGRRYFVTFIDDRSRFTFVYLIGAKSEVLHTFKVFAPMPKTRLAVH